MREAMVVLHVLAEQVTPNEATSKQGRAAAMSEMLSSVRLKAHLGAAVKPFEQADVNLREINSRNSMMGVMKTELIGTSGKTFRRLSV